MTGSTALLARHEGRLAWREAIATFAGGRRTIVFAAGFLAIAVFMHVVAGVLLAGLAGAGPSRDTLVVLTAIAALAWPLVVAHAMEPVTRAFHARGDLDLLLAAPIAATQVFVVRLAMLSATVAATALVVAAPFVNALAFVGGPRWLAAYAVVIAGAALATAAALAGVLVLFRLLGPRHALVAAQVLGALAGAAVVVGLQVWAILAYATLGGLASLDPAAFAGGLADSSLAFLPARAAAGDPAALAAALAGSFGLLAVAGALAAPRFAAIAEGVAGSARGAGSTRPHRFRVGTPDAALRRKEWLLLRRDPWLPSQTLTQLLYLVPAALLIAVHFGDIGPATMVVPVLAIAAGQLAGGLAWLTLSGEDAPDLLASAPVPAVAVTRAKAAAVAAAIAAITLPLVVLLALTDIRAAAIAAGAVTLAAGAAMAIQWGFRRRARRSEFGRRQVKARTATLAEGFSSMAWAAAAGLILAGHPLPAAAAAGVALAILAAALLARPRS